MKNPVPTLPTAPVETVRPYLALVKLTPERTRAISERIYQWMQRDLQIERERQPK